MAWIYHNATLWLISLSSDGSNWITIADKNLWATTVWNSWDSVTESNCGKYYQRWNNYWFPLAQVSPSSTRVNASNYWPNNYYSSSTFINNWWYWDSSDNKDLRWWVTGTNSAMKWPCDVWFHIPSISDVNTLSGAMSSLWVANSDMNKYLKVPYAKYVEYDWIIITPASNTSLWTSNAHTEIYSAKILYVTDYYGISSTTNNKSNAFPIRPFKNEAVIPDYNDVWDTLYWDELPDRPEPPLPKLKRLQKWWNYYYFKEAPTHASAISLNKSSITLTEAWQTEQLVATVTPSDAVDKSIIWTSSNENVARVSSNWLVSCITPWDCTITATTNDWSHTASCSVSMIHVTGVSLNVSTLSLNTAWETSQLTATITPSNASNKNVTWTSSNTSIATVSSTGLVTCVTPWSATITVTTEDWWYTASCSVINKRTVQFTVVWWGWWWAWSSNQVWWSWWWGWWIKWSSRDILWDCIMVTVWAWWTKWNCKSSWWDWWNSWITEYSQWTVLYNITWFWWKWWKYNNALCAWLNYWWDAWWWCISSWGSSTWCLWWNWGAIQEWWWGGWWWASSNWCWQTIDSYFPWAWWCWIWWCWWGWGGWWWCHRTWSLSPDHCDWACWCSWWWNWWWRWDLWWNATTCWSWWWWAWAGSLAWWAWAWWVVTICYKTDWSCGITCATWWTKSTSWAYTIHTFTSSWRFCIIS